MKLYDETSASELAGEMNYFIGSAVTHLCASGIERKNVEENLNIAIEYIKKELSRIGAEVKSEAASYVIERDRLAEKIGQKFIGLHPGKYLRFLLDKHCLTASDLARKIDCPVNRITHIMHGERGVSANSANRFGFIFDEITTLEWKILQSEYDIRKAEPIAKDQVPNWQMYRGHNSIAV